MNFCNILLDYLKNYCNFANQNTNMVNFTPNHAVKVRPAGRQAIGPVHYKRLERN